jgi:hypothetical protein
LYAFGISHVLNLFEFSKSENKPKKESAKSTTSARRKMEFCLLFGDYLGDDAGADCKLALANRETQPLVQRGGVRELNGHFDVISWHAHLRAF